MTSRIDNYAVFFAEIDRNCKSIQEVTQRSLFSVFGAEGLRRGFLAVSFLCQRLDLLWDAAALEDMIETTRIDQQTQAWRPQPWALGLTRYMNELDRSGPPALKRKTVRMYLTAASGLLRSAGVESSSELIQAHLDRYLKRNPGQSANLSPFIRHLRERAGVALTLKKKTAGSLQKKDQALVLRVQLLTKQLEIETDERRAKALLVGLLANVYQLRVKDLLALRVQDVEQKRGAFVLWPGERDVLVDGRLATLFSRWVVMPRNDRVDLFFSGRNSVQPLSYDALRYHVKIFK